jgi:hypothetical protein
MLIARAACQESDPDAPAFQRAHGDSVAALRKRHGAVVAKRESRCSGVVKWQRAEGELTPRRRGRGGLGCRNLTVHLERRMARKGVAACIAGGEHFCDSSAAKQNSRVLSIGQGVPPVTILHARLVGL